MAKNNRQRTYYNNNGSSKTKSGWKGVIAAFTASALILGAAAGVMGYGTDGFKDWSFNNFSHKTENTAPPEAETNGNNFIISEYGESNGISLMSARVAEEDVPDGAESAVTLTATVTPNNAASTGTILWGIKWLNEESEWAQDKAVTDYVTLTPDSDDKLIAAVENIQAFGEPIIITVTVNNTAFSAECRCDYSKKVTGVQVNANKFVAETLYTSRPDYDYRGFQIYADEDPSKTHSINAHCIIKPRISLIYSDTYTLEDEFSFSSIAMIPPYTKEYMVTIEGFKAEEIPDSVETDVLWGGHCFLYNMLSHNQEANGESYMHLSASRANAVMKTMTGVPTTFLYCFVVNVEGTYSSHTFKKDIGSNYKLFNEPIVEDVSLNNSSIVF